jgi:hypothetical protein
MTGCDNSKIHISSNLLLSICLLIMLDTLLLEPSLHCNTSLHFTTLHFTTLHFTPLHLTTLIDTSLHFTPLHFTPLTSLHLSTLHYTSPHYTSLHFTTLIDTCVILHNTIYWFYFEAVIFFEILHHVPYKVRKKRIDHLLWSSRLSVYTSFRPSLNIST